VIPPRAALDEAVRQALGAAGDATEVFAEHTTRLQWTCRDEDTIAVHQDVDVGVSLHASGGGRGGTRRCGPLTVDLGAAFDEAESAAAQCLTAAAAEAARDAAPEVIRAQADLTCTARRFAVARRDGLRVGEDQLWLRLEVQVLAERGLRRCGGTANGVARVTPGRAGVAWAAGVGRRAAARARRGLDAVEIPAGDLPVILQGSAAGAWLHEAVGHGLEADLLHGGDSPFAGRIGQTVAAPGVTVVDDGGIPGLGGSLGIDDEGVTARATVLIEAGVLRRPLVDRGWASRGAGSLGGNGRRASFRDPPLPRMTCTYLAAGDAEPSALLAGVQRGLLCRGMVAGEWDRHRGEITFTVGEATLLEGGVAGPPVRPVCLVGRSADLLGGLRGIGSDLAFSDEFHTCTKAGQELPVGVGAPTLRVDGLRAHPAR
jgi:TldD protein